MDQLVQCPVCTLYLHNGMSLESHLDTHPKDQVIKALCSLSANRSNYGSRASTPMHSERSYRSRSRTPATEDGVRWNNHHVNADHERYWRRTPSRTPKTSTVTRSLTPDVRIPDVNFQNASINNPSPVYSNTAYPVRITKSPTQCSVTVPVSDYDQQYQYFQEQKEEREIKYSRSAEYTSLNNTTSNVYAYNMPTSSCMKLQNALMPTPSKHSELLNIVPNNKKQGDFIKILPKSSNIALVKTNVGSMQYIATPGVMVSTGPTFQKTPQNSLLVTANLQNSASMVQSKTANPVSSNHYNHMTTNTLVPNTTVVTQNSQIIYSEMVHNIDGKRFLPSVPAVLTAQENITNVAQTNSMYQNVMVVDQFGNTSCMYTPQQLLPKQSTAIFNQSVPTNDKNTVDPSKTLIIEVGPLAPPHSLNVSDTTDGVSSPTGVENCIPEHTRNGKIEPVPEAAVSNKGLKILSNIKVEVPVQHHKNLLNTVVDLTLPNDCEYSNRSKSPERILPDLEDSVTKSITSDNCMPSTSNDVSAVTNTFSVIKNVGNPPSYKESKIDIKNHETESSDSCPVPDLICNEKPSISPCSELSYNGDNVMVHTHTTSVSPRQESSQPSVEIVTEIKKETTIPANKSNKNNSLRLNNIYVKKHKKVLQIKNAKTFPIASTSSSNDPNPGPSDMSPRIPKDFILAKINSEINENKEMKIGKLETVSIDKIDKTEDKDFDADTEEQSMDIELEPVQQSTYVPTHELPSTIDLTQVKEEVNSSHEFSNHTCVSEREFTELESMRPINVVQYGNIPEDFDDDSNHRELLDLEAASKNKHFVSMMNDNYFGDNIYADYFTPDRVEAFDAVRESNVFVKDPSKDGVYLWGESSQKDSEFVLPNFIHESYKIAESNSNGTYNLNATVLEVEVRVDRDGEGCTDSKADVLSESRSDGEPSLNICADERMPPRGELSGQESNGDMEASWNGMYQEVTPSEPYDLIARESWVSDGSDVDSNEKQDNLEVELPKPRLFTCMACGLQYPHLKELRAHRVAAHPPSSSTSVDKTFSRLATNRAIKKEVKADENILAGMLQDSKACITSAVLEVYEALEEAKPKLTIIKQEPKRRRRDYVCPTCKIDQLTDVAFHQHLKIHPLECLTCGKCFFKRANLALHIKTHLGIKNYKCSICEKRFITRQKLLEHTNIHTGQAPIKCTMCDHSFRRYSNMVQHRDRHHFHKKPKIRDYVCHCGEIFHSRAKLRWHKETHDGKPKACQYCSDKFVHMSSLTRHVRRSHNSYYTRDDLKRKNENVPCPVCKQVYLRSNLKTHMRTHSGKRPYVCVICNKAFTTQWNLKLHRWTHMSRSSKPFKCTLCKGAFIRQSEYISHMNAHKSVRPYTCNYCGCQFIRKYNCQRHVREHEMSKKYVCKVPDCGKSFHRSYYLSEHMKVHSGARPFSCNICGKTSSNKSNHNKHVKIHHAREPVATEA